MRSKFRHLNAEEMDPDLSSMCQRTVRDPDVHLKLEGAKGTSYFFCLSFYLWNNGEFLAQIM